MREEKSKREKLLKSCPGGENKSIRGLLCHPNSYHRTRATYGQRYGISQGGKAGAGTGLGAEDVVFN